MILTLAFVATLNGKITKGGDVDVSQWSSRQDQQHFKKIISQYPIIIRSSTTYNIAKTTIDPNGSQRHIVMTRDPKSYESEKIEGVLEFTNESPRELIDRLKKEGIEKSFLSVGGILVSLFLKEKLVDNFYLTLEPKIFGKGTPIVAETELEADFKLESIEKLNAKGTLLLKYKLIK